VHVLLLGAGFSRNWGGWLASELIGELSGRLLDRYWLGEMLRVYRNFERAYAERLETAIREPENEQAREDVVRLNHAIQEAFTEMNTNFARRAGMEFSNAAERSIASYLARFDAIFTLNQDLLLEAHYRVDGLHHNKWPQGAEYPGVASPAGWHAAPPVERIAMTRICTPRVWTTTAGAQPIYKLHGSVDWRTDDGQPILIVGTGKETAIATSEILHGYHDQFANCINHGGTRLMVIGYSFSDEHINQALIAGRERGLEMYLVNPSGLAVLGHDRSELSKIPLAGLSTRPLSTTFGDNDDPSFSSFLRFFVG
jgi:hypothetical protein